MRHPVDRSHLLSALLPTTISMIVCFTMACTITWGHILIIIVSGQGFVASVDGYEVQAYAAALIGPVAAWLSNATVANVVTFLLWAGGGWLICLTGIGIVNFVRRWQTVRHDVAMPSYGTVIRHPQLRELIGGFMWRLLVGIGSIGLSLILLPVMRFCLAVDMRAVAAPTIAQLVLLAALSIGIWMLILHAYLTMARLYARSTR